MADSWNAKFHSDVVKKVCKFDEFRNRRDFSTIEHEAFLLTHTVGLVELLLLLAPICFRGSINLKSKYECIVIMKLRKF